MKPHKLKEITEPEQNLVLLLTIKNRKVKRYIKLIFKKSLVELIFEQTDELALPDYYDRKIKRIFKKETACIF